MNVKIIRQNDSVTCMQDGKVDYWKNIIPMDSNG